LKPKIISADKLRLKRNLLGQAVVTAAGLGTRLLPLTKEVPKEMLPIFYKEKNNTLSAKPVMQVIFDQLFEFGFSKYQFVINGSKRLIKRHFTIDNKILDLLKEKGSTAHYEEINSFYQRLDKSSINYVDQLKPLGFGDAVLQTEPYIDKPFLVQAGDNYINSNGNRHLLDLISTFQVNKSTATFLVKEVKNPEKFGVIEGLKLTRRTYLVENVYEKPSKPVSNLAIIGLYYFHPEIFHALKLIKKGINDELQLTDGIQKLIDLGYSVTAVKLNENDLWFDIGNINSYWDALMVMQSEFIEDARTQGRRKMFDWGEKLLRLS
jgi:UTP--glucose-1-phosphate uridylyltransferase